MLATPSTRHSLNPLETYFRQIDDTPLLSAQQERELAHRIEGGDAAARDHLVRANLRLVVSIARRYQGQGLDLQDLIAEGNLGLLRAAEGFDASRKTRFTTYAAYWIRQSIKRGLLNTAKTIRLPSYMAQLLTEWRRETSRLQDQLGRPPTEAEVSERLHLRPRKIGLIKKALRIYNAMPQGEHDGEDSSLNDLVADGRTPAPDMVLGKREELQQVLQLVDGLDPREQTVLRLRFGLDGQEPHTLKEIGRRLGLTRERVRQIEQEALSKLSEGLLAG
jgi:RNA polymerase primary sigma factor